MDMMRIMKEEHVKRLLNPAIAAIVILLTLLPFAILSYYSHPQADDFSAAATTLRLGYFKAVASVYSVWNGRFFSTALMQANPLAFGSITACKLIPFAVLLFLFWTLLVFIKAVFPQIQKSNERILCALVLLALYLSRMPSLVQGFYWISGAINYQLANGMMLLLWAQMTKLADSHRTGSRKWTLTAAILLIFAVSGSNETHMATMLFIFAAALAWRSIKNRSIDNFFAVFFILAAIASAIVIIAPGNYARMAHDSHAATDLAAILKQSAAVTAQLVRDQATNPLFLILTVCAILFFTSKLQNSSVRGPSFSPGAFLVFWICGILVTVVPVVRVLGWVPDRVLNVTVLIFIAGWFLLIHEVIRRMLVQGSFRLGNASASRYIMAILIGLAILSLWRSGNVQAGWKNLLDGSAARYDSELRERYAQIQKCTDEICVVPPLTVSPSILFHEDIGPDPDFWLNRPYAEYFGKKAIMLGKGNQPKP